MPEGAPDTTVLSLGVAAVKTQNGGMKLLSPRRLAPLAGLLPRVIVVMVVFAFTADLGLRVATMANAVTLIWAPSGVALVAVLLWGPWMLLGIVPATLLLSLSTGAPLGFNVFAAAGNAAEAFAGAFLLRRVAGGFVSLRTSREVLGLVVLAAGLSTALGASLGTAGLLAFEMVPGSAVSTAWWHWWLGDARKIWYRAA